MFSSNTSQVSNAANYIEDVFSTWLYTGNGSTQTINNGIDLAGKGGMVWGKTRDTVIAHTITDTVRGVDKELFTNTTGAQVTRAAGTGSVFAFNSNGFSTSGVNGFINYSGLLAATWTFREQPKFFDVVTYTGDGTNARQVSHSLGSSPGFVIIKRTDSTGSWWCWHSSFSAATDYMRLNTTEAVNALGTITDLYQGVSSTAVTVGTNSAVNGNGFSYVMYVFAHNAGGFGLTGTDNVISCGSFTANGSGAATVDLGYEPQWVVTKSATSVSNWFMNDNMRGMSVTDSQMLRANTSGAEDTFSPAWVAPTATGFNFAGGSASQTYIYIAIRRGPMKVPTTGTSVFAPVLVSEATSSPFLNTFTAGFPVDWTLEKYRPGVAGTRVFGRLTGTGSTYTNSANAETSATGVAWDSMTGATIAATSGSAGSTVIEAFRRAPSFMDVCCYTGNGTSQTITHNLSVVPELLIVKRRNSTGGSWGVYSAATGNAALLELQSAGAVQTGAPQWNNTTPTASVFSVGTSSTANASGGTYVAYLFATCPGVSKVGSYTGNDVSGRIIDCGFTGGARFVLLKCTSQSGDWFVWDSARGITSGNDPYLLLNSTAAEETGTNYVDTHATGFRLNAFNSTGDQFIFLAIA